MTEKRMWRRVRGALARMSGHGFRVEASMGEVGPGTPDAVVTVGRGTRLMELKRWGTKLSGEQRAWCEERDAACPDEVLVLGWRRGKWWLGSWREWDPPRGPGIGEFRASLETVLRPRVGR